jgi:hypothetical protein
MTTGWIETILNLFRWIYRKGFQVQLIKIRFGGGGYNEILKRVNCKDRRKESSNGCRRRAGKVGNPPLVQFLQRLGIPSLFLIGFTRLSPGLDCGR